MQHIQLHKPNFPLALILFTESEDIARNDIDQTAHALLDMGLPVGIPDIASTPIADRAGNAAATVPSPVVSGVVSLA